LSFLKAFASREEDQRLYYRELLVVVVGRILLRGSW
jgi:hypothetical protein